MTVRFLLAVTATALCALLPAAQAAQSVVLQRQDLAIVKGMAYPPRASCRGIALVSPGAGGNEKGYDYLAQALASLDYLTVVIGHPESSRREVRRHSRGTGATAGLEELITEPQAYRSRYQDIDAYRQWAQARCAGTQSLLVGHSMGAATVMMQAGARNRMGMTAGAPFDGYVALSPQGTGDLFPANAWQDIRRPVLMLTGTRDDELGGDSWRTRTEPFANMPGGCQWLGVIDGATHLNFAGTGRSRKTEQLTSQTVQAFVQALRQGDCRAPPVAQRGLSLQAK